MTIPDEMKAIVEDCCTVIQLTDNDFLKWAEGKRTVIYKSSLTLEVVECVISVAGPRSATVVYEDKMQKVPWKNFPELPALFDKFNKEGGKTCQTNSQK